MYIYMCVFVCVRPPTANICCPRSHHLLHGLFSRSENPGEPPVVRRRSREGSGPVEVWTTGPNINHLSVSMPLCHTHGNSTRFALSSFTLDTYAPLIYNGAGTRYTPLSFVVSRCFCNGGVAYGLISRIALSSPFYVH
ncbi:hypothetical protein, unlikely [Trypanosoma brucei gambiense DAL972]|uniref:Uncharacterized protein n=1 Tax=Trypanosoma brucei gambiense (strain MHOM/CI/86/DAL972) TaxID=679716 RepID=D0A274_TRYB9|nr:hypothetical protein, unlikely [Trypanosoma brucei gambiense DAL972]CBH15368.1 hypothetical protein, unlikely [Trypanosoma brucei gambiense DAL972]|eukprot:XP_011777632.1 hypothetical protein, unlikely [Trypanosoma brucei gambiense DAL972]